MDPDQLASSEASYSGSTVFSVDPDQLASSEASYSGSTVFSKKDISGFSSLTLFLPFTTKIIGFVAGLLL